MNKNNSQSSSSDLISLNKWDHRFMSIAFAVASWSSCLRHHVAAVIVKDNHILATGYNGAPSGIKSCHDRKECIRNTLEIPSSQQAQICYAIHAEQNAILQAARLGVSLEGTTIYCTHKPCSLCTKCIINAGISRIVYAHQYSDSFVDTLLENAEIQNLIKIERIVNYETFN